jgi:NitT/TauT family transport system substrate-binding protein
MSQSNDEGWNMKRIITLATALAVSVGVGTGAFTTKASAAPKKEFDIAWTIYVGWMPWQYAADSGIVK